VLTFEASFDIHPREIKTNSRKSTALSSTCDEVDLAIALKAIIKHLRISSNGKTESTQLRIGIKKENIITPKIYL
jgi:hypothetical protein